MPDITDKWILADATNPGKLCDIKLGLLRLFERRCRNSVMDARDDGAVARGVVVEIVCCLQAAGARQILYDNCRTARQMGRQEARDQAGVGVIDAARA